MDVLSLTLSLSLLLRLVGVGASLILLYHVRDRRFAFLTLLLSLMAVRQLFALSGFAPGVTEIPGLLVSVFSLVVIYYLYGYVRQEQATKAELTETNRTLRASRSRLAATVAASPEDVVVFDAEGRCVEIISGNDEDVTPDLVGRSVTELFPPEPAGRMLEAIETTRRTGTVERIEYTVDQDGDRRWYDVRTARVDDSGSSAAADDRVLASRREITERKERERDRRRFRRAVDAAGAAVYITDRDATIVYVNPAFEDITGYAAEEAIGRTPRLLSSGAHDEEYYERLWDTIESGRTWREEITNERKSGDRYHASQTIAPVFDEDGGIVEYVAIQIEVTDRKLRERQLAVLDRILRHNLRNDLSLVLGYAETIEEATDGTLRESARRIRETGTGLLEKAETERRVVQLITENPTPRPLDVRPMVDAAVETVRTAAPAATIELEAPESASAVTLPALETALEEVLENAVVHGDAEPRVWVTVEATDGSVTVRIADDGPGIPEQERAILTEKHDIDALYHGSGIGLWYVFWVVKLSGGQLSFEERSPRGSVVVITLDRADR
ncbi:PAS domain-containing protein [Halopenitus persicus]|uniref:PAS domain-containing protein n=1 Tax=Halopenitus persicus TaxID=1048396 RepID=UPI000BBA8E55|nr:PAS domain-containing sensor histidine kinase [Halopenitus persicus]